MKVLILIPASGTIKNIVRDLVYGCWCGGRRIGGTQMPPLNLLYVATVLKENNHEVEFVDAGISPESYEDVKKRIHEFQAIVALSSTNSFRTDTECFSELKALNKGIKTIVFGSHPTFMPAYCLKEESVDFIVRREPEYIIRDILNDLERGQDPRGVPGVGYRGDSGMVLNEFYPFIENLDDLPIPDRSFLPDGMDYFNPVVKRMPYTTMQTSRGCPGACNFCTVPTFYGKRSRYRSAENVVQEMRMLKNAGYREIFFRDEMFTVYRERNREICDMIKKENIDLTWICNARVDMLTEDDVVSMKSAGCHMIKLGVESGNQQILDNIKKGITLDQTRNAFRICHKHGMDVHAHVMLGCPGETRDTLSETIRFIKEMNPLTVSFGIHTPYPGTELFREVAKAYPEIEDGIDASMDKLHIRGFFNESFTGLSKEELEKSVSKMYRAFYFRPGVIIKRLFAIRTLDELMRWVIAGSNIFSFGITEKQS